MVWKIDDPQGGECFKIMWELVPYTRGLGLDIGCGPHKPFPHFIGVDNKKDVQLFGIQMNPDMTVPDASELPMYASCSMDFVFSSHLLEHIEEHEKALREWFRLVKPGGHLCLYLPHKELYPNIGKKGANPDHKHDFLPGDISKAMEKVGGWDLIEDQVRDKKMEYSFFQVYKKYADAKLHRYSCREPKPTKTCAIVRYGAFGDAIQMTSILPALKEEGYHITVYTVPRGHEVIKHEPNIDRFILQDTDQVPNDLLGDFFDSLKLKYDRFINLCESVECTLLAVPYRVQAQWPHEIRHKYLNVNYSEFTHELAQVPYTKPLMRFVATPEEKAWAKEQYKKMEGAPLIMWCLSGSGVNKVWQGVDTIMARTMLAFPNAKVITVGDKMCQEILEAPWKKEPRIFRKSNVWSIRETMVMAEECDLVVGPETGVMSACAMLDIPKIVLLSHSSVQNLTRDWVNTYSIFSTKTKCYPCHKMIYAWEDCVRCDTGPAMGTAQCQADIPPDAVWDAMLKALNISVSQIGTQEHGVG